MHRCATGEHRGDTLMENAANIQAITQLIVDERDPGWEMLAPLLSCARDVWPHPCVHHPWRADGVAHGELDCWQRSGGAPMKPQGWSPNDGWFCWPGADDPAGFLRNAGVVVHITREGEPLCGATFAPDDVGFYAKERVHINCRDCLGKAHEMWPQKWPKPAEFAEK